MEVLGAVAVVLAIYFLVIPTWEWWTEKAILVTPNRPAIDARNGDRHHYVSVIERMRTLGPPSLRAVRGDDGEWLLLEGSHRAHAAAGLRERIHIIECRPEEIVDVDCFVGGKRWAPSKAADVAEAYTSTRLVVIPRRRLRVTASR